jgi:hypothetical protein
VASRGTVVRVCKAAAGRPSSTRRGGGCRANRLAVPVACPMGRSLAVLRGYSRTSRQGCRPACELVAASLFAHSQADSPQRYCPLTLKRQGSEGAARLCSNRADILWLRPTLASSAPAPVTAIDQAAVSSHRWQLHRVAELCRSNDQGGACGAAMRSGWLARHPDRVLRAAVNLASDCPARGHRLKGALRASLRDRLRRPLTRRPLSRDWR